MITNHSQGTELDGNQGLLLAPRREDPNNYIQLDFRITTDKSLLRSLTPPLFERIQETFTVILPLPKLIEWVLACLSGFGFEILRSRIAAIEKPHHPDLMKMIRLWNSGMIVPQFSSQRLAGYTFNGTRWAYQLTALRDNASFGEPGTSE